MDMITIIKKAAEEAVNAGKPADAVQGTVTSISPLKIMTEQKMELTSEFLVLTEAVKDHEMKITVEWNTESTSGGSGYGAYDAHNHAINGKKEVTVHAALKKGDKVVLLRASGGQKFYVVGRI